MSAQCCIHVIMHKIFVVPTLCIMRKSAIDDLRQWLANGPISDIIR